MTESILDSVKKMLNIVQTDTSFDLDIKMNINAAFSILTQLGIGPADGFMIEDSTATWDAFIGTDKQLNLVKTYVSYKVRLMFDPPANSFTLASLEKLIEEFEWRLNTKREGESWVDPTPPKPQSTTWTTC